MEMASIGFLVGAVVAVIFVGIGVCFGDYRHNRNLFGDDSDVSIYVPMRRRNRSGNKRGREYSEEEVIFVLNNIKRLTQGWERETIEYLIDMLKGEVDG